MQEQFGRLAPTVERLYPLSQYQSPCDAYRTIMADSASVCPMLQTNQELAKYIPVYVDINTDADNPAGEDLTLPLGAQHSGTNGLVHFPPAPHTPTWAPHSGSQHPVMLLQPADTSIVTPEAFIAAQHNCGFWNEATHY